MKLTYEQKRRIAAKFNEKKWKQFYKVEIYDMGHYGKPDSQKKFGLNWSAIGTVDNAMTKRFIKQLMEAMRLVDKLNSN